MKNNRNRPYPHFKFPEEITIKVSKLTDSDCKWFGVASGSFSLRCIDYGWFPTEVLMGVVEGKYTDTNILGAAIGGNMGTASIAVIKVDEAVEMLKSEGYNIITD